jgi:integrase
MTATQSPGLDQAVHLALSRMIGTQSGTRVYVRNLPEILGAIADGRFEGGQNGRAVMLRLGLSPRDLDNRWAVARANGNLLPRALVEAFFAPEKWPHFENFIVLGPMAGWQKVEATLSCWARGFNADGTPRRKPLAANSVDFYINAVHRLMRELCELRKLAAAGQVDLDAAVLDGWVSQSLPKRVSAAELGSRPADSDRRAPSLRAVRLALRALDRDVAMRKQTKHGRRYMARALRSRALLGVFVTLGGRAGAIGALRRGDFVRFHRSQGHEGPALMLRPAKGLHSDLVRVKFIPLELGEWLHEWIEYAGIHDEPDAPLWVKPSGEALQWEAIRKIIIGLLEPFVPDRQCSPHTLRHLCEKLAFLAGMDWLAENRDELVRGELSGFPASPQTFADALLDHALNAVQDTYKDINSEQGRETWARIAAEGVWALVWGEKGAPKGPDPDRVSEARKQLEDADADCRAARGELQRLETRKKVVREQAIDLAATGDVAVTLKGMLELDALADEVVAAVGEAAAAERRLDDARRGLEEAKVALVPLPDEDPIPVDAALIAEAVFVDVDGAPACEEEPYRRQRITPREFQWAMGGPSVIAESTLRRYLAGKLPYRRGDRRNVWDPPLKPGELPDCVDRPSPRRTWILLDRVDWSRFPVAVIDRLKYLQTLGEEEIFAGDTLAA